MIQSFLKKFVCVACGRATGPELAGMTCPACGENLDARYDYGAAARLFSPEHLKQNPDQTMWRYQALYPNSLDQMPLPLPVGMSPLTHAARLGPVLGLENLWIKNETLNPSGSFKDRASLMVLAHCLENKIPVVSAASTGNAGTSMACLAAAAGIQSVIFVPGTAPRAKIAQLLIYGARVFPVNGDYTQAFDLCEAVSQRMGWFNRNTGTNPYTREGKKTVSFEIWEQMDYQCPDAVVVPVGDGNIISGVAKGFQDLKAMGLVNTMPRLFGVQSEGSAAIASAFLGDGVIRRVAADTLADSISASLPSDGTAAIKGVAATGGTFAVISDAAIQEGIPMLARTEGIFAEPSGAAGIGGIRHLLESGDIGFMDRVVVLVTGNGLKDIDAVFRSVSMPAAVDPDPDRVMEILEQ